MLPAKDTHKDMSPFSRYIATAMPSDKMPLFFPIFFTRQKQRLYYPPHSSRKPCHLFVPPPWWKQSHLTTQRIFLFSEKRARHSLYGEAWFKSSFPALPVHRFCWGLCLGGTPALPLFRPQYERVVCLFVRFAMPPSRSSLMICFALHMLMP